MKTMTWKRLAIKGCSMMALAMVNVACGETLESENIESDGIYAAFQAVSDGSQVRTSARLLAGGATSNVAVILAADERLTVNTAGQSHVLARVNQADDYAVSFPGAPAGTVLTFSYDRSAGKTDAPSSQATLPADFAFSSPAAGGHVSRAAGFTLSWATPDGVDEQSLTMNNAGDTPCVASRGNIVPAADGSFVVTPAALALDGITAACEVTLTLQRTKRGTVDPAFGEGGWVGGTQERSITLVIDPT